MQADAANAPVPTVVLGGFLGAGKTTLVNHLLRESAATAGGPRIAVLVNDFGSVNIDAQLITGQQGDVMSLAGGCVCCSFGSDLVGMLNQVALRKPPPDVMLIEGSGVTLPAPVARSARLAQNTDVQGIVMLADAASLLAQARDPYVGDVLLQQLREADLLLLNKTDLLSAQALQDVQTWLQSAAPQASVLCCQHAQVPVQLVLGFDSRQSHNVSHDQQEKREAPPTRALRLSAPPAAADHLVRSSLELAPTPDASALARHLAANSQGLLRAKGFVTDQQGQRWVLQAVGPRWSATTCTTAAPDGASDLLVMIGVRGLFKSPMAC